MSDKKNSEGRIYPLVQSGVPAKTPGTSITTPRKLRRTRLSERGLLSVLTLILGTGGLMAALLGGGKLILDILNEGLNNNLDLIWAKSLVLGLAYIFGWLTSAISIRVYGNLILPSIIRFFTWATLGATSILYIMVLQRLFRQSYDLPHYWAYLLTVASGLAALVGLHLILEEHDLRPYAIPLFVINLMQLGLIVIRYVFADNANGWYLWGDFFFFGLMTAFPALMLAHLGLLGPYRQRITRFFQAHSRVIQSKS